MAWAPHVGIDQNRKSATSRSGSVHGDLSSAPVSMAKPSHRPLDFAQSSESPGAVATTTVIGTPIAMFEVQSESSIVH
jgi:hypothetical protein